jgi:hypothetical protein
MVLYDNATIKIPYQHTKSGVCIRYRTETYICISMVTTPNGLFKNVDRHP